MRKLAIALTFFFGVSYANAQTNIQGVINDYSAVTLLDYCVNGVELDNPAPFAVGDRVLLIQMQGADIRTNNTSSFGSVNDYQGAGNFEILTIGSITGANAYFTHKILKDYNDDGAMQLVKIPQYTDANITDTLTSQPWNGSTGGVLILEVSNSLSLNAPVDVSYKGFRGAALYSAADCWNGSGDYGGYACDVPEECGGRKGEGVAGAAPSYELGRGPLVNGGGGGNDHNAGGGGGGNYAAGGDGGQNIITQPFRCKGTSPGKGGLSLPYDSENRIFMGGGGGAGDDNNATGTGGGNGGGIVIIIANELTCAGHNIISNGQNITTIAGGDGAGGGGAGGTFLFDVNNFNDQLHLIAMGGDGGSLDNGFDPSRCFGPGGGGAGGTALFVGAVPTSLITDSLHGGLAGLTTNLNAHPDCFGSSNDAEDGGDGDMEGGFSIAESDVEFVPVSIVASNDTIICKGETAPISANATVSLPPAEIKWSTDNTGPINHVTPEVTFTYFVSAFDDRQCIANDEVTVTVVDYPLNITATPPPPALPGTEIDLSLNFGGPDFTYNWTPNTWLSSTTIEDPTAAPLETVTYTVTITDSLGCESTADITIVIEEPNTVVPDVFTPNDDGLNDFLAPVLTEELSLVKFQVFNRWGELVFETSDINTPWDGTYQGEKQPVGSYTYYMSFENSAGLGTQFYDTGVVTLIR